MCYHNPQQVTTYLHAALEWLIWSTRRIPGGTGWLVGCSREEANPHVHTHRPADYEMRSQLVCKGLGCPTVKLLSVLGPTADILSPLLPLTVSLHSCSLCLKETNNNTLDELIVYLLIRNFFSITSDWIYFKRLNNKAKISKIQWNFICCPVPIIPVRPFADSLTKTLMRWRHVCEGSRL